jgi:predicted DCC family thiol-disulfide oxidoreductase YuxK
MKNDCPILIYDGACSLCVFSKKRIEQWDTKKHIRFLSFQDKQASILVPELASMRGTSPAKSMDAMRLVSADGSVSSGVDAFRGILPSLPMGCAIAFIFRLPGVLNLSKKIYRIVARNRIAWFGKCH